MTLAWVLFECDRCWFMVRLRAHIEDAGPGLWRPAERTLSGAALLRLARAHHEPHARRLTVQRVPAS